MDVKIGFFVKPEKGAKASSIIYSIMETAKANKLMVGKIFDIFNKCLVQSKKIDE